MLNKVISTVGNMMSSLKIKIVSKNDIMVYQRPVKYIAGKLISYKTYNRRRGTEQV